MIFLFCSAKLIFLPPIYKFTTCLVVNFIFPLSIVLNEDQDEKFLFDFQLHQNLLRLLPKTIRSVNIVRNIIRNNDNAKLDIAVLLSEFSYQYKHIYQSLPIYSQHILSAIGNTPSPGQLLSDLRETTGLPTSVLSIYLRNLCAAGILTVDKSIKKKYRYAVKAPLFGEWLSASQLGILLHHREEVISK